MRSCTCLCSRSSLVGALGRQRGSVCPSPKETEANTPRAAALESRAWTSNQYAVFADRPVIVTPIDWLVSLTTAASMLNVYCWPVKVCQSRPPLQAGSGSRLPYASCHFELMVAHRRRLVVECQDHVDAAARGGALVVYDTPSPIIKLVPEVVSVQVLALEVKATAGDDAAPPPAPCQRGGYLREGIGLRSRWSEGDRWGS